MIPIRDENPTTLTPVVTVALIGCCVMVFLQAIQLRAVWVLGLWFVMQLLSSTLTASDERGIAFAAHIGGFIAGIALIPVFKHRGIALQNPFGPDPHR